MLSYFEQLVQQFFKVYIETKVQYNYRPDWLNGLELDLFFSDYNLAIEVNGANHFLSLSQQERDSTKQLLCKQNKVKLITITHPAELLRKDVLNRLQNITGKHFGRFLLPEKLFQQMTSYSQKFNKKYYKQKYNTKGQNKSFQYKIFKRKQDQKDLVYKTLQQKEKEFALYKKNLNTST